MNELIPAYRSEKSPKLHTKVKILQAFEYKYDENLSSLIKSINHAPIEWKELSQEFLKRKDYAHSKRQLPGMFLELHVNRILKKQGHRNLNIINEPITDGFSTENFVFKKGNDLDQISAYRKSTNTPHCEYDNLVLVTSKQGERYLIVVEAKSGNLEGATTEGYREKLFEPLKEYREATPEEGISGLGYILVNTNKQKTSNLNEGKTAGIRYNNIGAIVSISEPHDEFLKGALDMGKKMNGLKDKKDKNKSSHQIIWISSLNLHPTL